MPTRNVNLTDHYDHFIEAGIAEGRFSNASEAVRAGLHLLEREAAEDKAKIDWLRSAAQEGIDAVERGDYTALRSRAAISSFVQSAGSARRLVSAQQLYEVRVAAPALADIAPIWDWTLQKFGQGRPLGMRG